MMPLIEAAAVVVFSLFLSGQSVANETKNISVITDCLDAAGGSAHLIAFCYLQEGKEYQKKADKKLQTLSKTIPSKSKKLLIEYRASVQKTVKACELKYQAYNDWKPNKDTHQTMANVVLEECVYEARKQEYDTYTDLMCLPDDSCGKN